MICFAKVCTHTFLIQAGHDICRGDSIDVNRNQPLTRRILYTTNDRHPVHFGKSGMVACAMNHGVSQRFFMRVNGGASGFKLGAPVRGIAHLFSKPLQIIRNIGQGGIGTGITGSQLPIIFGSTNKRVMRQRG